METQTKEQLVNRLVEVLNPPECVEEEVRKQVTRFKKSVLQAKIKEHEK